MSYDINAIKKKIAELSERNKRSSSRQKGQKLTYFKPKMGMTNLRFLPYNDGQGQPFQQIDYYDNKNLYPRRIVVPAQWGLPDPVADLVEELQKERAKDVVWNLMRQLYRKESYYAPVLVRDQQEKGVQIWELNQTVLNQVYSILAHPDFVDENLFDPKEGYDFTVNCTDSGKTVSFRGKEYTVKNYDIQPRRHPSPIAETQKEIDAILESIPDLSAHFKQYCMNEDKLKEAVENFLAVDDNLPSHSENDLDDHDDDDDLSDDSDNEETTSKIEEAFKDL